MTRTRWGDEIPDEYDARREGRAALSWDRNPYDNFGVSRAEEEAHDAWARGHRQREDERRENERRENERREQQEEHDRHERATEARREQERYEYEDAMERQRQEAEQDDAGARAKGGSGA